MKILPPRTAPPPARLDRRHTPRPTKGRYGYQAYRACLRWEFGFTCGFCLLHESDFIEHGAEGTGLMTIEHFVPVSADEAAANDYENCFYACRFCNGARSHAPVVDALGRRLLDPCRHAWGEHFEVAPEDELRPWAGDPDGTYTALVYDLNDPRKVQLRRSRRERLEEWLALLVEGPELLERLLARCAALGPGQQTAELLRAAQELHRSLVRAARDLQRYAAVPSDAATTCRCGHDDHHGLPPGLSSQTIQVALPDLDDDLE